ncbi:MAG: hypothetical protein EOO44_10220 [Flavobacterium sp.]|nr:MAG: hypothetical protein EOO44_10220 [Flavobacterium sp.]
MKKFIISLLVLPFLGFSQEKQYAEPTKFIENSGSVQVNMDENEKTIFKSGFGESVAFYPSEIINLKNNKKINGLVVESSFIIKYRENNPEVYTKENAWIGLDEIPDLIVWLQDYVIPSLESNPAKKRTAKYIFNTKEVQFKFEIYNNNQIFTIAIKDTNYKDKYFWTETKVKDIPNILKTLKYLQAKSS